MEHISISIQVLSKTYKLKIPAGAEEQLRAHVKQINEASTQLKQHFAGLEDFDYLAMSVVQTLSTLATHSAQDPQETVDKVHRILKTLKS
jgi:cell division protein ZapA (FtsZ GTPase activity inhibitor)